jgi:cytochrome b pre-mRNA-processing protein 3
VTGLAQKLREKAPLMTETYVAYGATRDLMKECTKAGEYKIPQAQIKGGEIPTDENGVHLGEGEGWWYESKFSKLPCSATGCFFAHARH